MKKRYLIQMVCIALMLMLAMPTVAQKKTSKGKKANPYATVPASLITSKSKLDMLHSIQDLGDGRFFYLDYTEDYQLDEIIDKNVTTNEGLIGFVLSNLCDKMPSGNVALNYGAGCSAFAATSPSGDYMMGRNFDYSHGNEPIAAAIVQTFPKNGLKSVCMVDGYWIGYRQGLYQSFTEDMAKFEETKKQDLSFVMAFPYLLMDGMNEAGFAISVLHLDGKPTQQNTGSKKLTTTVAMRYLLDKAHSVVEAVELLKMLDLHVPDGNGNYHFYMADATGKHAVIEYVYDEEHRDAKYMDDEKYDFCKKLVGYQYPAILPNEMKVMTDKHCVSNFYLSPAMAMSEKGPLLSKHGRTRYDIMDFVLSQNNDTLSETDAMNLLNFVSQAENPTDATSHTQWSVVYNLSKKEATICVNRDYTKKFSFSFDKGVSVK